MKTRLARSLPIYIGLALVIFVVYPILVKTHGLSIKQYFSGVWPAVQLAFVSRSSIGTLPLTERVDRHRPVERDRGGPGPRPVDRRRHGG